MSDSIQKICLSFSPLYFSSLNQNCVNEKEICIPDEKRDEISFCSSLCNTSVGLGAVKGSTSAAVTLMPCNPNNGLNHSTSNADLAFAAKAVQEDTLKKLGFKNGSVKYKKSNRAKRSGKPMGGPVHTTNGEFQCHSTGNDTMEMWPFPPMINGSMPMWGMAEGQNGKMGFEGNPGGHGGPMPSGGHRGGGNNLPGGFPEGVTMPMGQGPMGELPPGQGSMDGFQPGQGPMGVNGTMPIGGFPGPMPKIDVPLNCSVRDGSYELCNLNGTHLNCPGGASHMLNFTVPMGGGPMDGPMGPKGGMNKGTKMAPRKSGASRPSFLNLF